MAPLTSFGFALSVLVAVATTTIASPTLTLPLSRRAPVSSAANVRNARREVAYVQSKLRAAEANRKRNKAQPSPLSERELSLGARASPSSGSTNLTECTYMLGYEL